MMPLRDSVVYLNILVHLSTTATDKSSDFQAVTDFLKHQCASCSYKTHTMLIKEDFFHSSRCNTFNIAI